MANNPNGQQGNNQQNPPNPNGNPLNQVLGHDTIDYERLSQSIANAINRTPTNSSQSFFQDRRNEMEYSRNSRVRKAGDYKRTGSIIGDIEEGIKDSMLDAIAGRDFKEGINDALKEFTKQFGFELKDLPHQIGKYWGQALADSGIGKAFTQQAQKLGDNLLKSVFSFKDEDQKAAYNALSKSLQAFFNRQSGSAVSSAASQAMSNAASNGAANAAGQAGAAAAGQAVASGSLSSAELAGIAKAAGKIVPIVAIIAIILQLAEPVLKSLGDFIKGWTAAFNRDEDSRRKRLENAQKRLQQDMETLARQPFEILTKAAEEWEHTWDENLSKIALTQGYNKESVYSLYSYLAERLASEDLESVIPATDIVKNLSSILDTGLSGKVAEEFAYQATKLSATIPTENFMGYASTYGQLASYALSQGKDQDEALEYANEQLLLFASNLLYSSRNLAGGFSTGLKDAQSLLKDAVDIAQSAKSNNVAAISGTLTSISGIIGAVAPDLAQGLVQNVVNAAIGGNSDSYVALRSLAGINAGNTDFLRALASDPQGVFVTIFRNLAQMQNMSPDNYMEVAEGLSSVFGVDMKAFARVDFNQLANSIAQMSETWSRGGTVTALMENLNLLTSGEATMSTEQLKLQEINNVILDQGLSYIIDSEAGRMIQQHMWEEQMNNALMQNEYAVNLQGAALSFLEGIRGTISNILNFLNPLGFIEEGFNQLLATQTERLENSKEVAEILERGRVGGGNAQAFSNLTNVSGVDLKLVPSLLEMMGGTSYNYSAPITNALTGRAFNTATDQLGGLQAIYDYWVASPDSSPLGFVLNKLGKGKSIQASNQLFYDLGYVTDTSTYINSGPTSGYSGFNVGKSALSTFANSSSILPEQVRAATNASYATDKALEESVKKANTYIATASEAAKTMSYDEFLKNSGYDDFEGFLEENTDVTREQLRAYFDSAKGAAGSEIEEDRKKNIQDFIDTSRTYWSYSSGTFEAWIWNPFLTNYFKPFFDKETGTFVKRMDNVDTALATIQAKQDTLIAEIGADNNYTVISVLMEINTRMYDTFIKEDTNFQKCLKDWVRYIGESAKYQTKISNAQAWNDLQNAEEDRKNETLLALANSMNAFSAEELQKLDPQLQTNALLGKIVIILEAIMQQNNNQAGSFGLIDQLSAMGFGMTTKTEI